MQSNAQSQKPRGIYAVCCLEEIGKSTSVNAALCLFFVEKPLLVFLMSLFLHQSYCVMLALF